MKPHLSAEEIADWMTGERTQDRERHVSGCEACRGEIARMQSALSEFRGAVRAWDSPPALVLHARPRVPRAARWLLAAAALALSVGAPVYRYRQQAAEAARLDAILLDQVDAEVSEAVPRPMQPLVQLVSWNSSSEGNGETQ
jgi:hypothetical protein